MSACATESNLSRWEEADRLAALRNFEILDTDPEPAFDDLATLATRICDAPIGVLNFIDEGRQWFKSEIGLGVRETPLDISICARAILQPGLFVVPDTTKDPRLTCNPLITGEPNLRFYAGALLETEDGLPLGTLCVLDYNPRPEGLTKEQEEALQALARAVMSQVKLRQANKSAAEGETKFRAIAEAMPQMIWSTRPDGETDYCYRRWYEFTGLRPGSMDKVLWSHLLHPDDQDGAKAKWQHSLDTGEPYEIEYRLRHHSGEYHWTLCRALPVRNDGGEIERWFGTCTDIHHWKQAITESEHRYRALVEVSATIVWRARPDGSIIDASPEWEAVTGQSPEAFKGFGWLSAVHPDDCERVISHWLEVLASRRVGTDELRVRHVSGEYRWFGTKTVPLLNADGTVREWVGTITDIHEQKSASERLRISEERHRALINASTTVVWRAGSDGAVLEGWGWETFCGHRQGSFKGYGWLDNVHPDDRENVISCWQGAIAAQQTCASEYRIRHLDGEYRWSLTRAVPLLGSDGTVQEWIGTITDIHEQKRVAEHIRISKERYSALIQANSSVVWLATADGLMKDDVGWTETSGQEVEAYAGDGWLDAVHADDRERVKISWKQAISSTTVWESEFRVKHKDGNYRWSLARGVPLKDHGGAVQEWVGSQTDIHDRKEAEENLRASEERLRLAIEATSLGIWDISLVTGARRWTPEVRNILGIPAGTPITPEAFLACVHPEDRTRVGNRFAGQLADEGTSDSVIFRITRADTDEERWITSSSRNILDGQGQPIRTVGTIQDITHRRQAEAELAEKAALLEVTFENMDQGLIMVDAADRVTVFNRRALDLLDLPFDFMASNPLVHEVKAYQEDMGDIPRDPELLKLVRTRSFLSDPSTFERTRLNGTILEIRTVPLPKGGAVRTYTDITARRRAEGELRASEERLRLALQAGRIAVLEMDLQTNVITRHQNTIDLLGIESSSLSDFMQRVHPDDQLKQKHFFQDIATKGASSLEFRYVPPDGQSRWFALHAERTAPDRVVGLISDISDRKVAEKELWRLANHDPLTGLPNRAYFQYRLERALSEAKQVGLAVSLLLIDLDDFKDVNDSFGHDAGDVLLKETATRLSRAMRDGDSLARLGGDEFAVLLTGSSTLGHASTLAEGIVKKLCQPISYAGQMLTTRASIGVAAFPDHHGEPAELMKDADMALYRAKAEGRNRVVTYSPEMRAAIEQRIVLRREMREAISRDQISPFYQPKVCLSTGEIVGFEALARWQHPTRGLLTPTSFGDAFDDPELATLIGKRLIGKVASDMRRWLKSDLGFGRIAINLSHAEFIQPGLAEDILRVLDLAKVPAKHFEIEITEKVLLDVQSEAVLSALAKFREHGVQVALDDFGTGYASLTHLKQFPVDHIKIDQRFVRGIEEDPDDEAIVTAVVSLGRSLNLRVTAEGVETTGQAQRLREMGCSAVQGYLFSKPMAGADIPEFLSGWTARHIPASRRLLVIER
ncbi:PAS domain-containing protein [Microvirga sp. GCM10011540]|uniref:PAS domain-containing protein n=1 Tax=Microvirga sp. GCM10011540 TaxID=3317338 RepID=UPI003619459E